MDLINDGDLAVFAFKEAVSRERRMQVKLKNFYQTSSDRDFKNLCAAMLSSSQSRINILLKEAENLNLLRG